jgi:hypothetical protein
MVIEHPVIADGLVSADSWVAVVKIEIARISERQKELPTHQEPQPGAEIIATPIQIRLTRVSREITIEEVRPPEHSVRQAHMCKVNLEEA